MVYTVCERSRWECKSDCGNISSGGGGKDSMSYMKQLL